MVSEDDRDRYLTYEIIDIYAKQCFSKEYATLPDPSAIQIDIVPDELFQPDANTWPSMQEPRMKVGHLIEQHDGVSRKSFANDVYASVSEHRTVSYKGTHLVLRVWYSTRDEKLSDVDWSRIQWLQPFEDVLAGLKKKNQATERSHLRTLVLYYMMANAHLDTVETSGATFLVEFQTSCECVARMRQVRQVRQGPGLEETPLLSPSLQAYNPTTPNDKHSQRTRKRSREDESDSRSSTPVEDRHHESLLSTAATNASRGNADKDIVEFPDVDTFLGFAESYKKMKAKNRKYKTANRKYAAEQEVARTDIAQLKDDLRARDATIQAQKADIERLEDCVSQEKILSGVWKEKSDESKELLRALTKTVKQNKTSLLLAIADYEDGSKSRKARRVRTGRAGKR